MQEFVYLCFVIAVDDRECQVHQEEEPQHQVCKEEKESQTVRLIGRSPNHRIIGCRKQHKEIE